MSREENVIKLLAKLKFLIKKLLLWKSIKYTVIMGENIYPIGIYNLN